MRGQKAQILDAEEPENTPKVGHLSGHARNGSGLIRQTGEILDQERVSWSRLFTGCLAWVGCRTNWPEREWLDVQRQGGRLHYIQSLSENGEENQATEKPMIPAERVPWCFEILTVFVFVLVSWLGSSRDMRAAVELGRC
jgi:hypothetical protein